MRLLHMIAALWLLGSAAAASSAGWNRDGDRLAVPAAGISFPVQAGTLSLTQNLEASLAGEGVDNAAQFVSPDRKIEGTVYVYLPAYADAALAAYETGKAIESRYAPGIRLASTSVVAAGGVANGAIRRIYTNAPSGDVVTTAAFAKAGDWIVKVRVTGPAARQAEIEADLDALIAGLAAGGRAAISPVAELQSSDCPANVTRAAKRALLHLDIPGLANDPITQALMDATLTSGSVGGKNGETPAPESIAANGLRPVCIREQVTIGDNRVALMQPAGDTASPKAIVGVVDDTGLTIEMERAQRGGTYLIRIHGIGRTRNYGAYDGPLSAAQVAALLQGTDRAARVGSVITRKADGKSTTEIYVATGK